MTAADPFGTSGYARVEPSGGLRPLTPEELAETQATAAYWPDRDHALDHDHCFLCGALLTEATRSAEHVFPQWLLRDLELRQQTITLLNGTTIPYASLTIPACKDCNNFWLSQVESQVGDAFRAGPDAVAKLDQTLLALWVAKIYYGLHFKEIGLPADRRQPHGRTILSEDDLRRLRDLHHVMQAIRRRVRFTRPLGSVIVLRTQIPDDVQLRFDYRDARHVAFIALRIGGTGVIASLLDWGAVADGVTIRSVESARQLDLHPMQFLEVAAAVGYAASKFIGEYMYSVHTGGDFEVLEPLLLRDGESPDAEVFARFSVGESAEVQAAFMGMSLEDIYDEEHNVVWTILTGSDGRPNPMSLTAAPMDAELITPRRAMRERLADD